MSNRVTLPWFSLLVVAATLARDGAAYAGDDEELHRVEIAVGEQYSISAEGIDKYSEGVAGIVDVRLPKDATEFIVVGLRPGSTTLLLIRESGEKSQYLFTVRERSGRVEASENIRLDFYFVELATSSSYNVGLAWPSAIGSGATVDATIDLPTGTLTSATASIAGHPLPRLDLLQASGWAKVARQASLITSNGKKAEFNSGGEVNIAVQGSLAAELRQIGHGTRVQVLPRFDQKTGRLELEVVAEVASLGESTNGVPSRNVSNITTVVNVEMNQAVVLAGIYAERDGFEKRGLPLLSQIPVIGALFGSHASRREAVQNVLFIVPSVVDVVAMDARRRLDEALGAYDDFGGDLGAAGPLTPLTGGL